jgi:hypothetical protein
MPLPVWQLFHGFQILFTTVLSVTMRHNQLFLSDWLSLFLTVAGICVAGSTSLIRGIQSNETTISTIFFAFILVFFSQGLKSFQVIIEEELTHDSLMRPSEVTVCEGLWGFVLVTFILLPITQALDPTKVFYDNTIEIIPMIKNSYSVIGLIVSYNVISAVH